MSSIGLKELLDAGVHFGHQTRRWNPKMKQYIFDERNGIHIIDLSQTLPLLETAIAYLKKTVAGGGKILFVATKKQAQQIVHEAANDCGQFFSTERWLGGTLTNFKTIKNSIKRMKHIEQMESDGSINNYVKQEQSMLRREHARMFKHFDGIRDMEQYPDVMFVVDIRREHNAVAEARKLKIPIVAIVDTNCDPDQVVHPIPGNDDAIRSIKLIITTIAEELKAARSEYESKFARKKTEEAAAAATTPEAATPEAATPAPAALPPEPAAAPAPAPTAPAAEPGVETGATTESKQE